MENYDILKVIKGISQKEVSTLYSIVNNLINKYYNPIINLPIMKKQILKRDTKYVF